MDIEVNYKNKKRYNTAKYPIHQTKFWTWLIWFLSKIVLMNKYYKVEKVGTENLKPPYLMLSNHMSFIDFELAAMATYPQPIYNVVTIEAYVIRFFLLEWIGSIATRRFTKDMPLIKSIKKVLKRGDVLSMYPEARYSPCGTLAYLPESLGKLVKSSDVPIVAVVHHGNHLYAPFWNFRKKRNVPFLTTFKLILTPEQMREMSVEEINEVLKKELDYDEYQYQKDNHILIREEYRAEGLHKALYQCPHCLTESKMGSKGSEIFCTECGKRWTWHEDGNLEALEGETEFSHIPDWFNWQREQVRKQIEDGNYHFEDEVEVVSLPRVFRYIPLGKAKLVHDAETGFTLEGFYRNERYYINRKPIQTNSLHVEYDFWPFKRRDCIDISTENDSFYCCLSKPNTITKIGFATEILYEMHLKDRKSSKTGEHL